MILPNEEVKELSKKFQIKVTQMKIIQNGVYRIVTSNRKEYCLKRMPYPPVQLHWIDTTLQRIRNYSSIPLGWRLKGSRKPLFAQLSHESPPFVLIPWIKGKWPSTRSYTQMRAIGKLLAHFHYAGNKIQIPINGLQSKLGAWDIKLQDDEKNLQNLIRVAKQNGFQRPIDQMLQIHGNEIMQMAQQSRKLLKNSGYTQICKNTKPTLCHGDFGPTNIITTKNKMYLIDFETLGLDLRAYDLYRAIFNSCQCNNWNFSAARSILDGYQEITKLKPIDFVLLKALLRFPRGICKLVEHYDQRELKIKRKIEHDFYRYLAYEQNRDSFIQKLEQYAQQQ